MTNIGFAPRSPSGHRWWWLRQISRRLWRQRPRARPSSTTPPGLSTPSTAITTRPEGTGTAGSASRACIMPTGWWHMFHKEMGLQYCNFDSCNDYYWETLISIPFPHLHPLHRSIPGVLVQEVLVSNPTGNSVIFNVERVGVDRWDGAKTLTKTWVSQTHIFTNTVFGKCLKKGLMKYEGRLR